MGKRWVPFLLCVCAWAQIPHERLFAEAQKRIVENLRNQPNYTCLETVERTRQIATSTRPVQDTLRLEVALVNGRELFAWPGAKEFNDQDLAEIIATGVFGSGNYGMYLRTLFTTAGLQFEDRGAAKVAGHDAVRFDFSVPKEVSGYSIRVERQNAVAGFHGSLYVDPASADLRRLEVLVDDLPRGLGLTLVEDQIDYGRSLIGDQEFLLPTESALSTTNKGLVSRNVTRFSNCRKFTGESAVIFEDPEFGDAAPAKEPVQTVELPPDALLELEIRSELNLRTAAVGDPVEAILKSDVRRGKERVISKGAVLSGRILRLEVRSEFTVLQVRFTEANWKGGHASVKAVFERREGINLSRVGSRLADADAMVLPVPPPKSFRGEILYYRTVR